MSSHKLHHKKYVAPGVDTSIDGDKEAETRYWKKFKTVAQIRELGQINSINFSPAAPHLYAVAASARIQLYSPESNAIHKTISRFSDVVYDARFRDDGRLIVAGDGSGLVQIFDLKSRAILRSFTGHTGAVRSVSFLGTSVLSGGNDKSVRVFDIATQEQLFYGQEHGDYVKYVSTFHQNPNLFISASYDHTVKLWDTRQEKSVMTLSHENPVESAALFSTDSVLVTASSSSIFVWDILGGASGGKLLNVSSNSQKTFTSLCFNADYSRLLAGSLDHQVKVYNISNYKVVHTYKYQNPITSVAHSPDSSHFVCGMANGVLNIKEKNSVTTNETSSSADKDLFTIKKKELPATRHEKDMLAKRGTFQFFTRGLHKEASDDDFVVEHMKKPRLKLFEKHLKAFSYKAALDTVLNSETSPAVVLALFEELIRRGDGLRIALQGRAEESIVTLLTFVNRHILKPKYTEVLLKVADMMIELYSNAAKDYRKIADEFKKIYKKVSLECDTHCELQALVGSVELLLSAAN